MSNEQRQDIQLLIKRIEVRLSNYADTDDYADAEILLGTGSLQSEDDTKK